MVAPDGSIVPDVAARLPGRGLWLSARSDVIDSRRGRAALLRAAKLVAPGVPVRVPDRLSDQTRAALSGRIGDLIGLARRAGQAVAGHERVMEWLASGRVGLLVQAADGAEGGRRKLARQAGSASVACPLPAASLGRIFGRDHAVHVAIAAGRLAGLIAEDCEKLAAMQPGGLLAATKSLRDGNPHGGGPATGGTGTDTE